MSENVIPVVVVSAFGRGHALAHDLRLADIPVCLVDVSPSLGESTAEDEEGPFGYFSQGLLGTELHHLQQENTQIQDPGFTWMLPQGPLEMRGPLAGLHRETLIVPESIWSWVVGDGPVQVKDHQFLLNAPFSETWFYHLSRSIHSNQWSPNYRAGLVEGSLPFGSDFFTRSVHRAGVKTSLEQLRALGVQVLSPVQILDLARDNQSMLKSFEYRRQGSDSTELLTFETVAWFLSGEETEKLSPRLQEKLLPGGVLRPKGAWIRSRLRIPSSPQRESLPGNSVWVQDIDLPWTHDNLFVLVKTSNPELFDLWLRIPEGFRFQKDYVLNLIHSVSLALEARMGVREITLSEEPDCILKTAVEVGPCRFPLFDEQEWSTYAQPKWRNFDWVCPETTNGLGWNFLFLRARKTLVDIKSWWKVREDERLAREAKAARQAQKN